MAKNPVTYVKHSGPVYTGNKMYLAGEPFTTDAEKGEGWERISPVEKAAADASNPLTHDDPNYDAMSLPGLQAVAATKKVAFDGLSKKDLITAIKAADEPRL